MRCESLAGREANATSWNCLPWRCIQGFLSLGFGVIIKVLPAPERRSGQDVKKGMKAFYKKPNIVDVVFKPLPAEEAAQ